MKDTLSSFLKLFKHQKLLGVFASQDHSSVELHFESGSVKFPTENAETSLVIARSADGVNWKDWEARK